MSEKYLDTDSFVLLQNGNEVKFRYAFSTMTACNLNLFQSNPQFPVRILNAFALAASQKRRLPFLALQ